MDGYLQESNIYMKKGEEIGLLLEDICGEVRRGLWGIQGMDSIDKTK